MKKTIFILISVLFSVYSYSQQDTLIYTHIPYLGVPDTINYSFIYPEVIDGNTCWGDILHAPFYYYGLNHEVSRLFCDNKALKSVAQGFMLEGVTELNGVMAEMGISQGFMGGFSNVGFKMGIMDASFNIIYEKDYLFDASGCVGMGVNSSFTLIPFDSVLYFEDNFVYIFMEWPDSACIGGSYSMYYQDDYARMYLTAFTQNYDSSETCEALCATCEVKYAPLFKWYGENYWIDLNSLRCDIARYYAYFFEKDSGTTTYYYPPIAVSFYYNNSDSGLSETDISNLVSLSPNPASDVLKINSSFKIREVEIHNSLGQVVLRKEGSQNIETLDVSILESGVYVVRIKTQRGFANKKLIIK